MVVIPAVDIKNGKCVRLKQGNFNDETVYSGDPVTVAKRWESEGARILHVVDLDGAKNGMVTNFDVIAKILEIVKIPVQVGGGIQNREILEMLLSTGVDKVILGTLALENEDLLNKLLEEFADQLIVALDSRDGKLTKKGWQENTEKDLLITAQKLEKLGVKKFIYTNVLKDGTLTKPDYSEIEVLVQTIKVPIIVAGGVSSIADIKNLKSLNVEAVVIGKALYEGKIDLKEAINVG